MATVFQMFKLIWNVLYDTMHRMRRNADVSKSICSYSLRPIIETKTSLQASCPTFNILQYIWNYFKICQITYFCWKNIVVAYSSNLLAVNRISKCYQKCLDKNMNVKSNLGLDCILRPYSHETFWHTILRYCDKKILR